MSSPPKKRYGAQLLAVCVGLSLFGVLLWTVGLAEVLQHIIGLGWFAPLILLPYAAIALCDAKGWAYLIPRQASPHSVPLWTFSLIRIAGEAVNNLTPTASIGGEGVKAYLLRSYGIGVDVGLASVVAAKTALTVAQVAFILLGLPFFLFRFGWGVHSWWVLGLVMGGAYGFVFVLIRWQRKGMMAMAVRTLQGWFPRWRTLQQWEAGARRIDAQLLQLYDGAPQIFLVSVVYHFFGWVLGAVEVFVVLGLIGVPITLIDALIIESMVQPVTAAALFIPGALGVREAGGVFLSRLLGIEAGAALALMVLKRAREAVYNSIGLLVLTRAGYRWNRRVGQVRQVEQTGRLEQAEQIEAVVPEDVLSKPLS